MLLPGRCWLLLCGLSSLCAGVRQGELAPPTINISLDQDPEVRWKPLSLYFDPAYLKNASAQVIDSTVPRWVHQAVKPVVLALEKYIPQPYAGEIRGLAEHVGGSLSDAIILNFAYEVSACTATSLPPASLYGDCLAWDVKQYGIKRIYLHGNKKAEPPIQVTRQICEEDQNGNVYHGRNLDYPHPVLRNLTINVNFIKNGKVAYQGTSFAGYVGLWTGQSPNKFTVSGDQRGSEHWWNWWKNWVSAFLFRRSPVSWLVRETLENAEDFLDAVMRLSKVPIITGVYYIVGGVRAGEGVVITRDRTGPADIWPLEPINGGWYRVETNYDHWKPPPKRDSRREVANKALNVTGQDHINMDTLYRVLSLYPVCNGITVYTTIMSAAAPDKYNTLVRPQGCLP